MVGILMQSDNNNVIFKLINSQTDSSIIQNIFRDITHNKTIKEIKPQNKLKTEHFRKRFLIKS